MKELKIYIRYVKLWEFKNIESVSERALKYFSVYSQIDINDC